MIPIGCRMPKDLDFLKERYHPKEKGGKGNNVSTKLLDNYSPCCEMDAS